MSTHEIERSLSAVPNQLKRGSDSSRDSRSISLSSGSIFSADTSSGSLDSSFSGGREMPGYDVPKRTVTQVPPPPPLPPSSSRVRRSEVNVDEELRKIDGLMEEVAQQRFRGIPSVTSSSANRVTAVTLDGFEVGGLGGKHLTAGGESKRSSSSNQGSLSSHSGSNDTLGVWDDVSFPDEEEEEESEDDLDSAVGVSGHTTGVGTGGEVGGERDGPEILDSWIKELESGMQGMSGVAGMGGTDVAPVSFERGWRVLYTVEPLIKDTLNKGHLCIEDTFHTPTYIVAIHFYL